MKNEEMNEYLSGLLSIIDSAEELRPIVSSGLKLLRSFSSELKDITDDMRDYIIDSRIASIRRLEDAGFSREDAINITMDEWYNTMRVIRQGGKTK